MPLFNLECQQCFTIVEKFMHNRDKIQCVCKQCNNQNFIIVPSTVHSKIRLNANDTFANKIEPEVNRIMTKISNGSDNDFLDIAGD